MIARRLLAVLLVLLTYKAAFGQEIRPAPMNCPPADGYEWTPQSRPVDKVLWAQVRSEKDFAALCSRSSTACTWLFMGIAIVFARNPEDFYSEAFKHHEDCHTKYLHGAPPMTSLYR